MQLRPNQLDSASLAGLGREVSRQLFVGDTDALADGFGYALAFERTPGEAIREDLARSLAELDSNSLIGTQWQEPRVSFFRSNDTGLFALVECWIPTDNGKSVLIEVIVTSDGTETHATLEQISPSA